MAGRRTYRPDKPKTAVQIFVERLERILQTYESSTEKIERIYLALKEFKEEQSEKIGKTILATKTARQK